MNVWKSNWPNLRRLALSPALYLVLGSTLLPYPTHGQATQSQAHQLAASIANVNSGSFLDVDIKAVLGAGAAQAVLPALEQQFAHTTDVMQQSIIANDLVRLGDIDNTYWNFLMQQAALAIDSDMPDPFHDSQWNTTKRQPSPELNAWAQAHHVDYSTAAQSAVYELPGKVMLLGMTGDSRGIPLLRQGLQSHNPMIVVMAARGLAEIQDKGSIPLIIEACRTAPEGFGGGIAEASLIFFDDSRAQSAVEIYVPEDRAKIVRDARAHGLKPFGY